LVEDHLEGLKVNEGLTNGNRFEALSQVHQLSTSEHLFNGDVLHAERGSVLLDTFHGFLEDRGRIYQLKLLDVGQNVFVHEVRLLGSLFGLFVVNLSIDANFRLVFAPLTHKKLVLIMVEVTALSLTLSVDPVAFEMVTVSLSKNTVAVAFSLMPLSLINVFVSIDHATLTLRVSVHPVAVVAVTVCVEEGATTMSTIFIPIASIFTSQLATDISPESTLPVLLIHSPHTLIFISIFVVLDSEPFLAVVTPVADVTTAALPFLSFDGTVFLLVLLFDPVDGTMSAGFVCFQVGNLPVLKEIVLHLLLLALLVGLLVVGETGVRVIRL